MATPDGCQCGRRQDWGGDGSGRPYCGERIAELEDALRDITDETVGWTGPRLDLADKLRRIQARCEEVLANDAA